MDELTTRRLAVIKQLYKLGISQSYDSEPVNGFCLLSFHDSVEMFMKLCADINNISITRNDRFEHYFIKLPNLQGQATMTNLNNKRVALKHHGILPSKLDIEISRANVSDFFIQNTPLFFNVTFDEISLISLIKYDTVRQYLELAVGDLNGQNFESAIINSQIAFAELLFCYEDDKFHNWNSPFYPFRGIEHTTSHRLKEILGHEFDNYTDQIQKSLLSLRDITKILGYGLDYKKYAKFKILTPHLNAWKEGGGGRKYETMPNEKINYSKKNAEFCFDFVIDSYLKLQEYDFDVSELYLKVE